MKANDVTFKMNSGDRKGDTFGFTLSSSEEGAKDWELMRIFQPAPSMVKERIKLGITARERNIPLSGAEELRRVNTLIDQLVLIAQETTPVTMNGLDGVDRPVRIDRSGITYAPVIVEQGKDPEYKIAVVCWGLYE